MSLLLVNAFKAFPCADAVRRQGHRRRRRRTSGVTEGGADRGLLDSNLLISGAHQKATRAFGKVSDSN